MILRTGASYHRRLGSAVPVEIVAGLPAESPGTSQMVVGINQSSRCCLEATVCTSAFPLSSGGEFSSPFGHLEPSALVDLRHGSSWACASCPFYQGVPESVFFYSDEMSEPRF